MRLLPKLLTLGALVLPTIAAPAAKAAFPSLPFTRSTRWIVDSTGAHVNLAGVNWPGAGEVMIPEGLQYQSIATIVSKIKSLGMNFIRLTYAISMIDNIVDGGGDVTLESSFNKALGSTNGPKVLAQVLAKNTQFTKSTTRLQVFDAIAAETAKQQIYVLLDNHMSKAAWCCNTQDGNSWFGDTYFDTAKWKRGLVYMANHGKSWTNLMGMSMRNELRSPDNNPTLKANSYNWADWYKNTVDAATQIYNANSAPLILFSGLDFDTTLAPVTTGANLGNGQTFNADGFAFKNKIVFELHNYQNSATSCSSMQSGLYNGGFNALDTSNTAVKNHVPVLLTEFGFEQTTAEYQKVYATCLKSYLPTQKAGWAVWVIAGSYYIRSGTQDYEETWGLLNHDWSNWRSSDAINNGLKPMVAATLAG